MGGSSKSKQSSSVWSGQQPYLRDIYSRAQNLYGGSGQYQYGPDRVSGFDPAQLMGQRIAEQRALRGSPVLDDARQQMRSTLAGAYLGPQSNPWLSGMYDAAAGGMTRNFMQTVMPTLNSRFAMGRTQQDAGQNAQTAAMGRAQSELAGGLSSLGSSLYGGAYGDERARQVQMAQMAPSMAQAGYMDASALRDIGQERQAQSQSVLDDLVARFDFNQYAPAQRLAEYSGFIGQPVTTSTGKSSSINVITSDVRLKKNITRVGKTPSGIPTYTFEYRYGAPGVYYGVIAQDLVEARPDAVSEMDGGYLCVDYSRIDVDFVRVERDA